MSQDALLDAAQMQSMADSARETSQAQAMQALRARLASGQSDEQELLEACRGFESIFMNKLWQEMRSTVPRDGYLHSQEEEFYVSLFDQELAQKMTDAGGVGLANMLYRQLQESADQASRTTSPSLMRRDTPVLPGQGNGQGGEEVAEISNQAGFDGSASAMYDNAETPTAEQMVEYVTLAEVEDALERGGDLDDDARQPAMGRGMGSMDLPGGNPDQVMRQAASLAAGWAQTPRESVPRESAQDTMNISRPGPGIEPSVMTRVDNLAGAIETMRSDNGAGEASQPVQGGGLGGVDSLDEVSRPEAMDQAPGQHPPLALPVRGEVSSGFGWRVDPFTGRRAFHAGLDVEAPEGSEVVSCWDGEVIFAGDKGNYGQMVIVEHADGWRSYYGHNSELDVEVGDQVRAGEVIARVGNTGRSTAPHLHFELRQRDMAWDPEQIQQRLLAGMTIGRDS